MFGLRRKSRPPDAFLPKDESKKFFGFNIENNINPLNGRHAQMNVVFKDGNPQNQKESNIRIVPSRLAKDVLMRPRR